MDDFNKDTSQSRPYGDSSSGTAGTGTAARMKEQVVDKANEVKEKVADFGRKAVDKLDAQREVAAGTLEKTASGLHQRSDRAASAAHSTADKLQATADYVRQHDLKAMMDDVQDLVKRYPGQSLAAAAVVGFLVARVFRSND
ncbi:MAG TPA: hypothetical protein VOA64_04650 [Candidatus Dormibacteraeota bacterium]|nr:hypothetical protein [Candidatus Dormibacteraeota bacterium]